jgi:hypothetical protein
MSDLKLVLKPGEQQWNRGELIINKTTNVIELTIDSVFSHVTIEAKDTTNQDVKYSEAHANFMFEEGEKKIIDTLDNFFEMLDQDSKVSVKAIREKINKVINYGKV